MNDPSSANDPHPTRNAAVQAGRLEIEEDERRARERVCSEQRRVRRRVSEALCHRADRLAPVPYAPLPAAFDDEAVAGSRAAQRGQVTASGIRDSGFAGIWDSGSVLMRDSRNCGVGDGLLRRHDAADAIGQGAQNG